MKRKLWEVIGGGGTGGYVYEEITKEHLWTHVQYLIVSLWQINLRKIVEK